MNLVGIKSVDNYNGGNACANACPNNTYGILKKKII